MTACATTCCSCQRITLAVPTRSTGAGAALSPHWARRTGPVNPSPTRTTRPKKTTCGRWSRRNWAVCTACTPAASSTTRASACACPPIACHSCARSTPNCLDLTGFRIDPVPGLVPTRTFYGALARRHFLSTQYIRHHSVPFYTPEPDIVHEIIGHANMLASPSSPIALRTRRRGVAARHIDASLEFFSRVFWFTIEFGARVGGRRAAHVRRGIAVVLR